MKIYKEKKARPLKWIIALVIFILTMTITFADVYGLSVPSGKNSSTPPNRITNRNLNNPPGTFIPNFDDYNLRYEGGEKCPPPSTIPEPTTMILLGMGLTALQIANRKRKK